MSKFPRSFSLFQLDGGLPVAVSPKCVLPFQLVDELSVEISGNSRKPSYVCSLQFVDGLSVEFYLPFSWLSG